MWISIDDVSISQSRFLRLQKSASSNQGQNTADRGSILICISWPKNPDLVVETSYQKADLLSCKDLLLTAFAIICRHTNLSQDAHLYLQYFMYLHHGVSRQSAAESRCYPAEPYWEYSNEQLSTRTLFFADHASVVSSSCSNR